MEGFMDIQRAVGLAQDILAIAFVAVAPFADLRSLTRLKQLSSSAARLASYRRINISTCVATAIALALTSFKTLFWVTPQTGEAAWLFSDLIAYYAVAACVTSFFLLALWPGVKCAFKPSARSRYGKAMRSLTFMLPVTPSERLRWVLVCLTAGVCEELLYRGFLLQYLRGHLYGGPALGLTLAWLLSSLIFGFGHFYQGAAGVVRTTIAGLMLGLLAILTGNLLLPIVVHCLLDLQVLLMYNPVKDTPEEVPVLISGFCPENQ
jgi:membrane protease YdiL (CAAX protease family)